MLGGLGGRVCGFGAGTERGIELVLVLVSIWACGAGGLCKTVGGGGGGVVGCGGERVGRPKGMTEPGLDRVGLAGVFPSDFLLALTIFGPVEVLELLRRLLLFTTGGVAVATLGGGGGTESCGAGGALPFRLRDLTLLALIVSESELEELSLWALDKAGRSTSTSRSGGPESDFSASEFSPSSPTPVETPSNHFRMLFRLSPQFLQLDSGCG